MMRDEGEIYDVGTFAQIQRFARDDAPSRTATTIDGQLGLEDAFTDSSSATPNVSASVLLLAHRRIILSSIDNLSPPTKATVRHHDRTLYIHSSPPTTDDTTIYSDKG